MGWHVRLMEALGPGVSLAHEILSDYPLGMDSESAYFDFTARLKLLVSKHRL